MHFDMHKFDRLPDMAIWTPKMDMKMDLKFDKQKHIQSELDFRYSRGGYAR